MKKYTIKAKRKDLYNTIRLDNNLGLFLDLFDDDVEVKATFEKFTQKRFKSYDQLKFIHAIIEVYAQSQGLNVDEAKDDFKDKFGYYEFRKNKLTDENKKQYRSFADCSVEQMKDFIEQGISILVWCEIQLPPTHDMENLFNYIDSLI